MSESIEKVIIPLSLSLSQNIYTYIYISIYSYSLVLDFLNFGHSSHVEKGVRDAHSSTTKLWKILLLT